MIPNLSVPSEENLELMVEEIKKRLKMAAASAIKPSYFDISQYEDIKDIYDWVTSKDHYSINEVEAIVTELGKLRRN